MVIDFINNPQIVIREEAFQYYFHFMSERMKIFWAKYDNQKQPWTADNILRQHKFTNVYRASDRVSQYLIKNVIYNQLKKYSDEDVLLRILIFKVFNRIDTWEFINEYHGEVSLANFDSDKISDLLSRRIENAPIFNSAYLMTGSHNQYNHYPAKHRRWLKMIEEVFIKGGKFKQILKAKSLEEIFIILAQAPFIGDFLAYQYAIDFNYSESINFDENSFVKAGIGAIRGIKKCFYYNKSVPFESYILFTKEHLDSLRKKLYGKDFENLFGREPTLIDLQNCFCETDKYLRAKMPELKVDNTRIKQKYSRSNKDLDFFFPPKWDLNEKIKQQCIQQSSTGLTLF